MTATSSISCKVLMDFDRYKNQEWLRRRKLRLEQVRKQSQHIAKALREKVIDEEKLKNQIYQKIKEAEFRDWKAEKLAQLEGKLRCALEEFGEGYKLAQAEPDPNKILQERTKINELQAQKRGELAYQEELKMKKMVQEKKMFPIQRKIRTRKMEDLRSALIVSVPARKQLAEKWEVPIQEGEENKEKVCSPPNINNTNKDLITKSQPKKVIKATNKPKMKKVTGKQGSNRKTCACKSKTAPLSTNKGKGVETIWINLNDIQSSTVSSLSKSVKSTSRSVKTKTSEGIVEFYDFSSRYFSRSYKEFPHLVERIEFSQELDAVQLAKIEEEREQEELKQRQEMEAITQRRGCTALRRQKISREYQNMMDKLGELNKKEKFLKCQQKNLPRIVHMPDERLTERAKSRQRLMDSKFESIYCTLTSNMRPGQEFEQIAPGGGDYFDFDERAGTGLSFSAANSKPNSPESTHESEETSRPQKNQLLIDIERALREGRELRRSASRNRSESEETLKADRSVQVSPFEGTKSQESQTYDIQMRMNDSLPRSTSTSYKSPPSEIKSSRLREFLECLSQSDGEQNDPDLNKQLRRLSVCLQKKHNSSEYPTLRYYIKKLLSMSRECIANLSVSSESISTPSMNEFFGRNKEKKEVYSEEVNEGGESGMGKIEVQEERNNWKNIFEKYIQEQSKASEKPEPENEPGREIPSPEEPQEMVQYLPELNHKKPMLSNPCHIQQKYDIITQKCSERISELTNMLEKIRKDKEEFLVSSGKSSDEEDDIILRHRIDRMEEPGAVGDSQSYPDESFESWPDVMNELMRKGILTSPFKWEGGHAPVHNKKPTIEKVFGNFRKEMNSIMQWHGAGDKPRDCRAYESFEGSQDVFNELQNKEIPFSTYGKHSPRHNDQNYRTVDKPTVENVIDNFRKEMNRIKPMSLLTTDSCLSANPKVKKAEAHDYGRESSEESINRALTNLGLNWAKSLIKKNKKLRAMSSSSEDTFSEDEDN